MPGILAERLWVPEEEIPPSAWDEYSYEIKHIDREWDAATKREVITKWTETITSYRQEGVGYSFPRGDIGKMQRIFEHVAIEDTRSCPPLDFDLQISPRVFRHPLWPDQERVVNEWLEHGYGTIQAPTRWGKTIAIIVLLSCLKTRVCVFCNERGLLEQWARKIREFTNINKLEEERNEYLLGFMDGTYLYPITLATYQQAWSSLEMVQQNTAYFGATVHDEAHNVPAQTYSAGTESFNAMYRIACTADPWRKDQQEFVLYDVVGPVVASSTVQQLKPTVYRKPGINIPASSWKKWQWLGNRMYGKCISFLLNNEDRNWVILEDINDALLRDRRVLVITNTIKHAQYLGQQLQDYYGWDVAVVIGGHRNDEQEAIDNLGAGWLHCIVSVKVMRQGRDLPLLDCVMMVAPNANRGQTLQIVGRPRTPCYFCPTCLEEGRVPDEEYPSPVWSVEPPETPECPVCKSAFQLKQTPEVWDYCDTGPGIICGSNAARLKVYKELELDIVYLDGESDSTTTTTTTSTSADI